MCQYSSVPAVGDDNSIYIGDWGSAFEAYNGNTGTLKWIHNTSIKVSVFSSPALLKISNSQTVAIFGLAGNNQNLPVPGNYLVAVGTGTGKVVWTTTMQGEVRASPTIAADGSIFIGDLNGNVYRIVGRTGRILWTSSLPHRNPITNAPALSLDDTSLYITAGEGTFAESLTALDATTGKVKWMSTSGDGPFNSYNVPAPSVDPRSGTVLFPGVDGKLRALNPDGSLKWTFNVGEQFTSTVAIADGVLYGGTGGPGRSQVGHFFAVSLATVCII